MPFRHPWKALLLPVAILLLSLPARGEENPPYSVREVRSGEAGKSYSFLIYLPKTESKPESKWPVIYFLHGAGTRNFEQLRPQVPVSFMLQENRLPFAVVAPLCSGTRGWDTTVLHQLVRQTVRDYPLNPLRLYLTGISMGGHGTWAMASEYPQLFAAIAPVCGFGYPGNAPKLKSLPIWGFHGEKDDVVPLKYSIMLVKAIERYSGHAIRYTVFPDAGHGIGSLVYEKPELYQWFLQHSWVPAEPSVPESGKLAEPSKVWEDTKK